MWLQVPFSSLPGAQSKVDTRLANGANYGFPVNTMHIVANKAWTEKNPAAAKLFAEMKLPIGDINAENAAMHAGHASEADINSHVDGWIKAHQAEFDKWVSDAMAAAEISPRGTPSQPRGAAIFRPPAPSVSEACAIAHWYVLLINTTLK